jgi:hypothetical protein
MIENLSAFMAALLEEPLLKDNRMSKGRGVLRKNVFGKLVERAEMSH